MKGFESGVCILLLYNSWNSRSLTDAIVDVTPRFTIKCHTRIITFLEFWAVIRESPIDFV